MTAITNQKQTVVRTSRGLSIAGTRITLYSIMDYLNAGWAPPTIRDWLGLSDEQVRDVLSYLAAHRDAVEREYAQVVRQAEEQRQFWEQKNRDRLAQGPVSPETPEQTALRAKLRAWKDQIDEAR